MSGRVVAVVPARGGSKGIPRKNLVPMAGRPLIAWSVLQGLEATSVDRVIVSTDDQEIAEVARAFGAEVPFLRPAELAGDLSTDLEVMRHLLDHLARNESWEPEIVVHLRPTGPVRRVSDIDEVVGLLDDDPTADAVRSVAPAHQTPYKMWRIAADGTMEPVLRVDGLVDCQSQPRQLLPEAYWQNGYVDAFRPRAVLEHGSMWGRRVLPFVVDTGHTDLDYPEDVEPVERALLAGEAGLPRRGGVPGRHAV